MNDKILCDAVEALYPVSARLELRVDQLPVLQQVARKACVVNVREHQHDRLAGAEHHKAQCEARLLGHRLRHWISIERLPHRLAVLCKK